MFGRWNHPDDVKLERHDLISEKRWLKRNKPAAYSWEFTTAEYRARAKEFNSNCIKIGAMQSLVYTPDMPNLKIDTKNVQKFSNHTQLTIVINGVEFDVYNVRHNPKNWGWSGIIPNENTLAENAAKAGVDPEVMQKHVTELMARIK